MASIALTELPKAVGAKEAQRLYILVLREYTAHLRKHAEAAKADNPSEEADFLLAVLDRADADPAPLTAVLTEEIDGV